MFVYRNTFFSNFSLWKDWEKVHSNSIRLYKMNGTEKKEEMDETKKEEVEDEAEEKMDTSEDAPESSETTDAAVEASS